MSLEFVLSIERFTTDQAMFMKEFIFNEILAHVWGSLDYCQNSGCRRQWCGGNLLWASWSVKRTEQERDTVNEQKDDDPQGPVLDEEKEWQG